MLLTAAVPPAVPHAMPHAMPAAVPHTVLPHAVPATVPHAVPCVQDLTVAQSMRLPLFAGCFCWVSGQQCWWWYCSSN